MSESAVNDKRSRRERRLGAFFLFLVTLLFGALAGRLVHIQRVMRGDLLAYAEDQQQAVIPIPARRGTILDRTGRVLAGSEEVWSCFADMIQIPEGEVDSIAAKVGPVLGLRERELAAELRERVGRGHVWIKRKLDKSEAEGIRSLNLDGVGIVSEPRRRYPLGTSMSHVLGFVGADAEGMEGVELSYDSVLRGKDGKKTTICDVRRRSIWHLQDGYEPPRDGDHLVLTLDAFLQQVTEEKLAEAVTKFRAESGVAVVMDPKTSEVLAMVSYPTFDPNRPIWLGDHDARTEAELRRAAEARRNRTITDPMEPGSSFKPFIAAAALEQKVTHLEDNIDCHGGAYSVGRRTLHDVHSYGWLTMEMVVAKSSNIGMAMLGERLGNARLHEYVRRFGFGKKTGIDLPGESSGMVLKLKDWTSYSTLSIPMGQEVAVTPIQLATALCAMVNGGEWIRPKVVRKIVDPLGHVIDDRTAKFERHQALSEETARVMTERVLVAVVEKGTGKSAQLAEWQVLGKTGTAQIARKGGGGYEPNAYVSVFMSAAPAHDPALVTLVMVRRPDRRIAYYGSQVAAPVAKEILRISLPYLGVKPDPPELRPKLALAGSHERAHD